MTYAELAEAQYKRSKQFAEAQTDVMMAYCDAERDLKELQAENAKLRKLCKLFAEYVGQDRCEGCVCKSRCNDALIDECWQLTEIRELASEFGLVVD